jgi:inhibitor of KinA
MKWLKRYWIIFIINCIKSKYTLKMTKPKITQYGELGILLNWSQVINDKIHKAVLFYQNWIEVQLIDLIQETNIGYQSLLILVKHEKDLDDIINILKTHPLLSDIRNEATNYTYFVPVCYDPKLGLDIETLADQKKIRVDEIIALHVSQPYKVYFTGFLPGFVYLGGLNRKLHIPRQPKPRLAVPKGSVAIGGEQTGVYPQESPGGWHVIGQTPIELFDVSKQTPSIFRAGDYIQFYTVSLSRFTEIKKAVESNQFTLRKEALDD